MCKSKQINTIRTSKEDQTECLLISPIVQEDNKRDWMETITLPNNIKIKFKLKSGAQCNVISKKIAEKTKLRILNSKTKRLISFSNNEISVVGECTANESHRNKSKVINFLVADKALQPILGKGTYVELGHIQRKN